MNSDPLIIPGCEVLPPEKPTEPSRNGKPKKPAKPKAAGRFAILNWFVDVTMGELSRAEIVAWIILYRDTRDGTVRTSQTDIARRGGMTTKTAKRAIKRLKRRGLIKTIHRGGLNKGPSRYIIRPAKDWFTGDTSDPSTGDTHDPSTGDISCHLLGTPMTPIP